MNNQNKILFIYKKNFQDPSLQALLKWLPKKNLNIKFFNFKENERSRFKDYNFKLSSRLEKIIERFKPTHVFSWVLYLNPEEINFLKKKGIKICAAVNGFSSLHSGLFKDQKLFFETLQALDVYFVPHRPHIAKLKKHKINAIEMPFFYDPTVYKPVNKYVKSIFRNSDIFFVGNMSTVKIKNTQSYYRKNILEELGKKFNLRIISNHSNFNSNINVFKSTASEKKINFFANLSSTLLCFDYFPDINLGDKSYNNVIEPYDEKCKYVIRPRVFAMMGTGRPVLIEKHKEIERFFKHNENVILWESRNDLIEKLNYFFKSKIELFGIGQNGLKEVKLNHTVCKRLDDLILPKILN